MSKEPSWVERKDYIFKTGCGWVGQLRGPQRLLDILGLKLLVSVQSTFLGQSKSSMVKTGYS